MVQANRSNSFGSDRIIIYIAQLICCYCISGQWVTTHLSNKY